MRRISDIAHIGLAGVLAMAAACPAIAQERSVLLRDSFPIGDNNGILCQVQDRSVENPARQTMFDRRWAVVCRDTSQPVSHVYSFNDTGSDPIARIAPLRREEIDCSAARTGRRDGWAGMPVELTTCRIAGTRLDWNIATLDRGGTTYIAEGFAAYDDATVLALRSVLDNSIARGTIDVASTSVLDPLAFARVQAETLKPEQALAEGYRRNLGGDYAEAAAYFETLQQRLSAEQDSEINPGEFLVNRALQKSNLGEFAEADRLFIEAEPLTAGDPIAERLQRNFEAIHLLNQGYPEEAVERLDRPLSAGLQGALLTNGELEISRPIADRLNGAGDGGALLGFVDELRLTAEERATIIDAQGSQLRGTAQRVTGNGQAARASLVDAYGRAVEVRDGRVTSITRLRAQILGELALVAERSGDTATAEAYLRNAISVLETQYPERRAVSGAKARLGAFLLRQGKNGEAIDLYRDVIDKAVGKRNAVTGFANQLRPYFDLIADRVETDPGVAEDFFKATQVLVRPGVAETQAILARELSSKSDEGARLFRQSVNLSRDIERSRIRFEALGRVEQTAAARAERAELTGQIESLEQDQLRTQALLNHYPEYRVVAPRSLPLADFRATLRDGEAYARMAMVGGDIYMFYTDRERAKAYRVDLSEEDLGYRVDLLRASISLLEGGRYVTYPYEVGLARDLYRELFAPVAAEVAATGHLVFEPDGAMLRMPVDILVTDDASVQAYQMRVGAGGDVYDFTGIAWLGRNTKVSTAVSAQAFVDARQAPRSSAGREYLGLGRNEPIGSAQSPEISAVFAGGSDRCGWSAATWNRPIDDAELILARDLIGEGQSELITGAAFTDRAVMEKPNLDEFRVLHFATHGLVTPPDPACPARPALLTSFGRSGSDGLLSFEEIFDLDLDADIVILSACDTAGEASIEATRAAGVSTGGGTALDGLVRSFIGAGGRAVMASHWPAPDDYSATERLISEMFRRGRNRDVGLALRESQHLLMDDPVTSHPYYWGGFAIIGDASRRLLSESAAMAEASATDGTVEAGR